MANEEMLHVPGKQIPLNSLSIGFHAPIFGTKKEYISMYSLLCSALIPLDSPSPCN